VLTLIPCYFDIGMQSQ